MPVRFLNRAPRHPITELQYECVTETIRVCERSLTITSFRDVEKAIDQVFNWLEVKGRDSSEIEKLAPYFGVVWPSALALCGYLCQEDVYRDLPGKSVLELGCGLAIPSILAAKAGACCTASDHHPDVPRFLRANVEQNQPCELKFVARAEHSVIGAIDEMAAGFDLVMASDVLYEQQLVETFAEDVTTYAKPRAKCVVADPGRPYIQDFVNAMKLRLWKDRLEPWTVPHQGAQRDIYVMIFERY